MIIYISTTHEITFFYKPRDILLKFFKLFSNFSNYFIAYAEIGD